MAGPVVPNQALLNGINPLAYMGVRPTSPALYLVETRDPLTTDKNYALGTWWMNNNSPYNLWRLANLNAGVALWILVSANPGALLSLTSNTGGAVFPLAGNINVVGDGITITGVGNPATHTITLSAVSTGTVETLTGNSGGAVSPLGGNINVIGDGTGITIVGNPGTHTLTASLVNGGSAIIGLHSQDGHTVTPTAGIINVSGGSNLTTTGTVGPNTLTISLSGITQHDVQVGGAANSLTQIANGTTGQVLTAQTGADPIWAAPSAGSPVGFFAYQSVDLTNVTGDGTKYQVIFDTVMFDSASAYNNATGVYTIPITGNWHIGGQFQYSAGGSGGTQSVIILNVPINMTYTEVNGSVFPTRNQLANFFGANAAIGHQVNCYTSLTAGATISITAEGGGGSKTDSLIGPASFSPSGLTGTFYAYLAK